MAVSLVTVLALVCICYSAAGQPNVLEEGGRGSAIVLLSIELIEESGVFADDTGMLRRIAYVETEDGIADNTYREEFDGGIWAVSESAFQDTQDTNTHPRLPARLQRIRDEFQIDWSLVRWNDLRKPFYSALAARLVLYNAPEAIPPTNHIERQAEFWVQYYHPSGSTADFVATASELKGKVLQTAANEFFIGFTNNTAGDTPTLQLFVTTVEPTPVNFFVETLTGVNLTGTATRNSTVAITLPPSIQIFSSTDRNKGIHVQAEGDKLIVVYGLNYEIFSSDAFLALPCNRLAVDEYEYYAITFDDSTVYPSTILLVGCEDNTTITTTFGTVLLNKQETYLIEDDGDLTGTRVVANKPISFFSGHYCTFIPSDNGYCDYLTEQVPPTASWGSFFIVASLLGRTSGEIYRIIAAQNSTEVIVSCNNLAQPLIVILNTSGNWHEIQLDTDSFCTIESNSAVLIMQFALGNELDGIGDPFMMMIPPVEQYSKNNVFIVLPANDFSASYITVAVTPQYYQPEQIFVDSFSLEDANWTTTYCSNGTTCGHITRMPMQPGEHQLYHEAANAKLGVTVYGFDRFNSYGYIGGIQLVPAQLATVSFSEATYTVLEDAPSRLLEIPIVRSGNTEISAVVLVAIDRFHGTAAAGKISDKDPTIDYRSDSTAEILEFEPGQTMKEFAVLIEPDRTVEDDESFELYLRAGVGVHLAPFSRATVTIVNDDFICDPSCENGACIAHDTCNCAAGYEGERCSEPVFTECEENPCMNGGSCRKHVLEYICNCLAGFSGIFCEIILPVVCSPPCENGTCALDNICNCDAGYRGDRCNEPEESSESAGSNTAAIVGGIVGGVVGALIITIIVVVVVIAACALKTQRAQLYLESDERKESVKWSEAKSEGVDIDEKNVYDTTPYKHL